MVKTKKEKIKIVQDLKEKFEKAKGYLLVNLLNLNASIEKEIRDLLKENNSLFQVPKKTLIYKTNQNFPFSDEELKFPFAFVWFFDENLSGLKVFKKLKEENLKIEIFKGYLFNKALSQREIEEIINIPSKEELLQKLVSQLKNQFYRLHYNLNFPLRKLVLTLSSIKK